MEEKKALQKVVDKLGKTIKAQKLVKEAVKAGKQAVQPARKV